MYQNQGPACKPRLGPLLAGVSKSPKVFQNHQCSDQLFPECFKITKSVSKSPEIPLDLSHDLNTWSVTWSNTWSVLVVECFKITKSVSKSPKIVPRGYRVIHNYTILVCFACLTYIMDRFQGVQTLLLSYFSYFLAFSPTFLLLFGISSYSPTF